MTILPELLAYVQLDDLDRARLAALSSVLAPHFPAIAERFYAAVWANPGAAAVLSGPAQAERLRVTLIDWMASGLAGPYDEAFYARRSRIGRRHVQIGLAQHYMFTAINVVRTAYLDVVGAHYPPIEALAMVRSIDKLFDIELALMLRHYQLDSEEKLVKRERAIIADRIGALQTMSTGLAHEIRNPLNSALLQLELLERRLQRGSQDAKLVEPTELARLEIGRLTDLLNDFLSFVQVSELRRQPLDVVAVIRHVLELEQPLANSLGCALELETAAPAISAVVDPSKLHQIAQNLVRNALEAAAQRGHVRVTLSQLDGHVILQVTDDGPGIPAGIRARIFEPFYSNKDRGTGLGLAIVHNFVTLHGGTIDFDSGPSGTTARVVLP